MPDCHYYLLVIQAVAIHAHIRPLTIERHALAPDIIEQLTRGADNPSRIEIAEPFLEARQVDLEKHDDAMALEVLHGLRAIYHAAAGGDDGGSAIDRQDMPLLELAK